MTVTAPETPTSLLWQPLLSTAPYRRSHKLLNAERTAIASYLKLRSEPGRSSGLRDLAEDHPLEPLLRPIRDALELMGSKRSDRNATQSVILRECLDASNTFWAWSRFDRHCAETGPAGLAPGSPRG